MRTSELELLNTAGVPAGEFRCPAASRWEVWTVNGPDTLRRWGHHRATRAPGAPGSERVQGFLALARQGPRSLPRQQALLRSCATAMPRWWRPRPRQPVRVSAARPAFTGPCSCARASLRSGGGLCRAPRCTRASVVGPAQGLVVRQGWGGRGAVAPQPGWGGLGALVWAIRCQAAPRRAPRGRAARRSLAEAACDTSACWEMASGAAAALGRHDAKPGPPRPAFLGFDDGTAPL